MIRFLFVFLLLGLLTACGSESAELTSEELLCSEATGDWEVTGVTCNGAEVPSSPMIVSLDPANASAVQVVGNPDCQASYDNQISFGEDASIQFTGTGNLSCTQGSASVAACSGEDTSCDSTVSIEGFENDFDQCVLQNESAILLSRTISSADSSDCEDGETEVISMVPYVSTSTGFLVISDGPTFDFGAVGTGSTVSHSFTVTNFGTASATVISGTGLAEPFAFSGGAYPGTGGDCGSTLGATLSCTISVDFSPTTTGELSGAFELSYNDGIAAKTTTRNLIGTGTSSSSALLVVSETDPYAFGTVAVGGVATHTFTVTNIGGVTATTLSDSGSLAAPFSYSGGAYPGSSGTCGATLSPSSSCDIVVEYSPVTTGLEVATITLNYFDGSAMQSVARDVQGTGANPAALVISDGPTFDFGPVVVGFTASHTFTVTNVGGISADSLSTFGLAAPFGFQGGTYPGTGGTCGAFLASGSNCQIVVEFAPTAISLFNGVISLNYNDGVAFQTSDRDVAGQGI